MRRHDHRSAPIPAALLTAAGGVLATAALAARIPLQSGGELDLTPAVHWPQPIVAGSVELDRGPVMVTVEYRVKPHRADEFVAAVGRLEQARRRDGAFAWGMFRDVAEPDRFLEYFIEESWAAHLRHHARVTHTDRELQAVVRSFHSGPDAPRVTHFLAADDGWPDPI